jgi:hypothetical protein
VLLHVCWLLLHHVTTRCCTWHTHHHGMRCLLHASSGTHGHTRGTRQPQHLLLLSVLLLLLLWCRQRQHRLLLLLLLPAAASIVPTAAATDTKAEKFARTAPSSTRSLTAGRL